MSFHCNRGVFTKRRAALQPYLFGTAALVCAVGLPAGAAAQEQVDADEPAVQEDAEAFAGEEKGDIIVTGSRVNRTNFTAPTPVSVMGADDMNAAAIPNVADFARSLPTLQGGTSASTSSTFVSNGAGGISAMNLRALGTPRTLVLLDGQRSAPSDATGQVDVNTFPQSLIERIEVVTGGASAAYGSDAVGGVVNFILNKSFTGLKGDVEYGETTYGDNANRRASLTFGAPFGGGKGHILLSGEYADQDGVHDADARKWNRRTTFAMQNSAAGIAAGEPYYIVADNIGVANRMPGGLITSGPLQGTYFGVDGSVNQFVYGTRVQGQLMQGGDYLKSLDGLLGGNSLSADEERFNLFGRVSYEFSPAIELFVQGSYAEHENLAYYINPTQAGIVIQADNPYIPQEIRDRMTDLGLTSFTMGSSNLGFPRAGNNGRRSARRLVIGGNGEFDVGGKVVNWDAYYQYGLTKTHELTTEIWNNARLALATDAVLDGNGDVVCRSTLTDPTNGCIPLNRIGTGVADPKAIDWIFDRPFRNQQFRQDVFALNFSTNDFQGWAGPISIAIGVEHRREKMDGQVDPQFSSGWKLGNFLASKGEYSVTEGYLETVIPLFKGFELNAAGRYTHYSTSGDVQTWKVGLTYQPIEDIKLRFTRSRDIRAPNMSEFFSTGSSRSNSVPINGQPVPFVQTLRGNPNLVPEVANSLGFGAVLTPRFIPGLAMSIDYYDIRVDGVITTLTAEQTVEFCLLNNVQQYCDNMHYVNGVLDTIDLYYENFNRRRAKGIDLEAAYRFDLGGGTVSLRALATHYIENSTDNGVTNIDAAGSNSGNTPSWLYRFSAIYNIGDWRPSLTLRGVSSGTVSNAYIECSANCAPSVAPNFTINDNHVKGALYVDASLSRKFTIANRGFEAFFSVKNLFNRDPAIVVTPADAAGEHITQFPQTNRALYDLMGREFHLGLRFDF